MGYEKFQVATAFIIGVAGTVVAMSNPEQQILITIITGFLGLIVIFSWPEYEYREQLCNPDLEPEKFSQWEKFKEVFLKMGWKVRKVRRRKQ